MSNMNDTTLDVERLAKALVTVTRQQAGEPDGEGWPGYVDMRGKVDVRVVLNVGELAAGIAAEYDRLQEKSA